MSRHNPARFAVAALFCCLSLAQGYKFCDDPPDVYNSPDALINARANCDNFKISDVSTSQIIRINAQNCFTHTSL